MKPATPVMSQVFGLAFNSVCIFSYFDMIKNGSVKKGSRFGVQGTCNGVMGVMGDVACNGGR